MASTLPTEPLPINSIPTNPAQINQPKKISSMSKILLTIIGLGLLTGSVLATSQLFQSKNQPALVPTPTIFVIPTNTFEPSLEPTVMVPVEPTLSNTPLPTTEPNLVLIDLGNAKYHVSKPNGWKLTKTTPEFNIYTFTKNGYELYIGGSSDIPVQCISSPEDLKEEGYPSIDLASAQAVTINTKDNQTVYYFLDKSNTFQNKGHFVFCAPGFGSDSQYYFNHTTIYGQILMTSPTGVEENIDWALIDQALNIIKSAKSI